MEFRILGPLQVVDGGRAVELAGPKQRTLLAALVLHAGRVVPKDRLFEILWGPQPPDGAPATLQSHVSHLREALEPGRAGGEASIVAAREPGYVLAADPRRDVDTGRFESLAAKATGPWLPAHPPRRPTSCARRWGFGGAIRCPSSPSPPSPRPTSLA